MIKIKVSNLSNGNYDYDFEGDVSDINVSEPYSGKFFTTVTLSKYDSQIILDSETRIKANLNCDRCNKEFSSDIVSKYRMIYLFRQNIENENDDTTDVIYLHPDADKIELDKDIRDFAVLAVPMKKLCLEDCKGLCPRCGKNLNEDSCDCKDQISDPRWEQLKQLIVKNKLK